MHIFSPQIEECLEKLDLQLVLELWFSEEDAGYVYRVRGCGYNV